MLPWIAAALVLYVATLVITIGFNVPLNNELAAAGDPDRIRDLAAVRERFEAAWVRWNIARRGGMHGRVWLPNLGPCVTRAHAVIRADPDSARPDASLERPALRSPFRLVFVVFQPWSVTDRRDEGNRGRK